ncbi:hypothetical protein JHK85_028132 [Glycine max]|nr:hypothetical protein JHK85_028132 [Glycine max]
MKKLKKNKDAYNPQKSLEFLDEMPTTQNIAPRKVPPVAIIISHQNLGGASTLNLSNNLLVGEIPKELQGLESLHDFQIFNNHLMEGYWTNLRVFATYENNFDGRVPGKLGFIYELKTLNLHSNHLEGPIPGRIFTSGKLEVLILTQNNLSCDLPVEIGNCQTLFSVRIGNNNLEGNILKSKIIIKLSVHLTRQSCPLGKSYL